MNTATTSVSPIQYEQWLDFATRMARAGWEQMTEARRKRLEAEVRDFIEEYNPASDWDKPPMTGWDGNAWDSPDPEWRYYCIGDHFREHFRDYDLEDHERRAGKVYFIDQIASCIRAGLNAAGDENMGVWGFSIGDICRMYPDGLPEWFTANYEKPEALLAASDDEAIWL